ncbi:uncharacterized protein ATC70_010561 [Mucor velutinosus]|uniref:Uncharacterized protein n=1 Tax=Mucor velutinosus TaxID=708070 RepID=A0AAN7DJ89_9FUNG|nr:hypothetical protein ATC70_010561 [Mucor velutinosus]
MPPPPYSKSTSSNDDAMLIKPKQAIETTNATSLNVSNVKDYLVRLKSISPIYTFKKRSRISAAMRERNIATTTDSYTENTKPSFHEPNAPSSSPFIEQNKSTSESSTMNDSLERIGTSLQLLIEEAQASLLTTSTQQVQQQETDTAIVDYSYRYVQHGYLQSQEKLALAIEKLEQSIHSIVYTASMQQQSIKNYYTTTHHHHHYYAATTHPSSLASAPSSSQPLAPSLDRTLL